MAKRKTNLSVVTRRTEEQQKKWQAEDERWKEAEQKLKIPAADVPPRVAALRTNLELQRDQIEAAPFDLPCGDTPHGTFHLETVKLVDDLDPFIRGIFRMIDNYAEQHGCHDVLDFNAKLFALKMRTTETAFQIGLLAGVIFAGCSKEQVDKFERGLVYSMKYNPWVVK